MSPFTVTHFRITSLSFQENFLPVKFHALKNFRILKPNAKYEKFNPTQKSYYTSDSEHCECRLQCVNVLHQHAFLSVHSQLTHLGVLGWCLLDKGNIVLANLGVLRLLLEVVNEMFPVIWASWFSSGVRRETV